MKTGISCFLLAACCCTMVLSMDAGGPNQTAVEVAVSSKPGDLPADIRDMTNVEYLMQLAQVHLNFGALDRADELLRKASAGTANDHQRKRVLGLRGMLLQRKEDWKGAAELLEGVYTDAEGHERRAIGMQLASVYERMKDTAKAEKVLSDLLRQADGPEARYAMQEINRRLLRLWVQTGRIDAVVQETEAALAQAPKDELLLDRLVEIYTVHKPDPAKAIKALEALIQVRQDEPDLYRRLAGTYRQTGQHEKALDVYRRLFERAPESEKRQIAFECAMVMLQAGKKDEAMVFAKQHLGGTEATPQDLEMLASLCEQAGQQAEAEKYLDRLVAAATTPQAKVESQLRIAESARRRKDWAKAEQGARAAIKAAGEDKGLRGRANSVLFRLYEDQGKTGELKLGE